MAEKLCVLVNYIKFYEEENFMGERILIAGIVGLTLACFGGSIAGIVISSEWMKIPEAEPRIQSLKEELPKKPSLTLPVNGN